MLQLQQNYIIIALLKYIWQSIGNLEIYFKFLSANTKLDTLPSLPLPWNYMPSSYCCLTGSGYWGGHLTSWLILGIGVLCILEYVYGSLGLLDWDSDICLSLLLLDLLLVSCVCLCLAAGYRPQLSFDFME